MATMASAATTVVFPTHRDLYYGGRWHAGKSGRFLDVANPATGAALGKVVDADANDVDSAVTAARAAFPAWRDAPAQDRARAVRKAAAILRAHAQELALLEATDGGNPLQPGFRVPAVQSSLDRYGYAIFSGPGPADAADRADRATQLTFEFAS